MMMAMRVLRGVWVLAVISFLTACNVVGKGNKLERLEFRDSTLARSVTSPLSVSQCLRYNLEVLGTFTDGSSGFYTSRATWSSSDPTVVRVSNGDLQVASDTSLVYVKGTIIPVGAGTATITANYIGMKANLTVTVGAVPTIDIHAFSAALPRTTTANANLTIAPRTVQTYAALATINGRVTDVTGSANWSVANKVSPGAGTCTNTNAANLTCDPIEFIKGSISSFRAKRLDDPISPANTTSKTIQADFNSLVGMNSCPVKQVTLSVANIDTAQNPPITVTREFTDPLIVATTERLKIEAKLVGGATQDISELGSSGDGTTSVTTLGAPIQPTTDVALNDGSGRYTILDDGNTPKTTTDSGFKTVKDCRTRDLSILSFTLTGLSNLIYVVSSSDANPVDDSNSRVLYASFITKPATATTTATTTCPGGTPTVTTVRSDAESVVSGALTRVTRTGTLTGIALCAVGATTPANSCTSPGSTTLTVPQFPQYAEDGARAQLRAIGTFNVSGGGTATQDITRSVTWTSSNTNIISVLNGSLFPVQAGQAAASQVGSVQITASFKDPTTSVVTTSAVPLTLTAQ